MTSAVSRFMAVVIAVLGLFGLLLLKGVEGESAQASAIPRTGSQRVVAVADAQQLQQRDDHLGRLTEVANQLKARLPEQARNALSVGALQLTTLGERVDKIRLAMERSRRA